MATDPSPADGLAGVAPAQSAWPRNRLPILLGIAATMVSGQLVRLGRFSDEGFGVLFSAMTDSVVLVLLIPLLALQRRVWPAWPAIAAVPAMIAGMLFAVGAVVATTFAVTRLDPRLDAPYAGDRLVQVNYYLFIFLCWNLSAAWMRARHTASDQLVRRLAAERASVDADMRRLRMQLDAHFIFNALNTIAVEIQDSPRQALLLVRELSHYLRYSFETADQKLVPISAEVAALRSFLRVQTLRFGSQLQFKVDQAGSTRGRLVPPFLLQPLVENATKHGVPGEDGVLSITVTIRMMDDVVKVEVTNPGDLMRSSAHEKSGSGLNMLSQRLALHFPRQHHFALVQDGDLVRAEMHLFGPAC